MQQDDLKEKDEYILFFKIVPGKIVNAARNWINSSPQTEATTFTFSFVFILLPWRKGMEVGNQKPWSLVVAGCGFWSENINQRHVVVNSLSPQRFYIVPQNFCTWGEDNFKTSGFFTTCFRKSVISFLNKHIKVIFGQFLKMQNRSFNRNVGFLRVLQACLESCRAGHATKLPRQRDYVFRPKNGWLLILPIFGVPTPFRQQCLKIVRFFLVPRALLLCRFVALSLSLN